MCRMKPKSRWYLIALLLLATVLCGCFKEARNEEQYDGIIVGDNSLDTYSFVVNEQIDFELPKEAKFGGASSVFMSHSGGCYYRKVVHDDYMKDYDTLSFSGKTAEEMQKWMVKDNPITRFAMGAVSGSDDYLVYSVFSDNPFLFEIARYKRDGKCVRQITTDLDGVDYIYVPVMIMDKKERIHVAYTERGGLVCYLILNNDGAIIHKETYQKCILKNLVELPNDDIAIALMPVNGNLLTECILYAYDFNVDEMRTIMEWNFVDHSKEIMAKDETAPQVGSPSAYNMFDENRFLVATFDGVYIVDQDEMENTLLYEWVNHGISPSQVYCIRADEDKNIYLMYGDEEGINYLKLSPTTEERPVKKILFAVSEVNKDKYMSAVAKFNKKHPTCIISLRECQYSDQQRLLTKMSAGEGAVIFDTSLVGFLQLDKMWEPLEDCFDKEGMSAFNEEVINLGKIDGKLYGAITDFYIETAFTNETMPNMDYDSFLEAIRNYSGEKELFNFCGDEGVEEFVLRIMCHNQSDCYFINDGKFDGAKFEEAVRLAEKYIPIEDTNDYYSSDFEEAYLNEVFIDTPAQLEIYRMRYGEEIDFIGLPGEAGNVSYLHGAMPVCIRSNADKEEKEIAKAFIKELLSYEANKSMSSRYDYRLSVRKDVLDEQISDIPDAIMDMLHAQGISIDEGEVDIENIRKKLKDIISTARSFQEKDFGYRQIIAEELDLYLSDAQTFEAMLDHVKSRVNIYLQEKE